MATAAGLSRTLAYRGWWIVLCCYLAQMIGGGASGWIFGVLSQPMGQDLGWSRTSIYTAITINSLVGGLLAARLGPLVDARGPRTLMTGSLLVAGIAVASLAFVHNVFVWYVTWAIFGLATPGFGLLGPLVVIANWFIRKRPLAFMFYTLGAPSAGIVLAPVMAFVATGYGWRGSWFAAGLLICILSPLAWVTVRRRPEDIGLLPDGDVVGAAVPGAPAGAQVPARPRVQWTVREALHTRAYWLLTAGFTLQSLPSMSIFIHMAPYVVSKGFGYGAGALLVSVYGTGAFAGRPVWGTMIARLGVHRTLVVYTATYAAIVVAFIIPTTMPPLYAIAFLLGIAVAGGQQLQGQTFPDYFGRDIVGTLQGYSGLAYTLSRAFGPLYAAVVFDATQSYVISFSSFAAASFLASACFFFAPAPKHPSTVEEPRIPSLVR